MSPLPGSDKYRVIPIPKPLTWEQKIIERARKEIKIEDVLSRYHSIHVPYDAVSWKVRCPYALEHEDGGLDKQFRVYSESNSGYCFAMHGRIDTIRLFQDVHSGPILDVAKALLDDFDIDYRHRPYQERFELLRQEHGSYSHEENDVVEAMKLYLTSIPEYSSLQYEEEVLVLFERFLRDAHEFCSTAQDFEEVEKWYQVQKENITKSLLSISTLL